MNQLLGDLRNNGGGDHIPNGEALERRKLHTVAVLVAVKVCLLFILAWNMRLVMDEFFWFGFAKYLSNGLFDTVWTGKAVGYAVFYKLAHLIGWDAVSTLRLGRMQTALLGIGTLAMVYAIARAIGATRIRALLVILILLSFSNMIERLFRTIAEPPALFCATASLLVVVRYGSRGFPLVLAGVLTGLAFVITQKSLYFNVALGLALVVDACFAGRYREVFVRGALLVLGWCLTLAGYCLAFGGTDPLSIAKHLFIGPAAVLAPEVSAAYQGIKGYVLQTLARNALLYMLCFAGMILALTRIRTLDSGTRIALIFSLVITALVFAHDQPWPYVFIMALPFLSLWGLVPIDALARHPHYRNAACAALAIGVAVSFAHNAAALRIDNGAQLTLVARAERLTAPHELYLDGVAMLPNRFEPGNVWLDRSTVLRTLREGRRSELVRSFLESPPKTILWNYRLEAVRPLIAPLIHNSYVRVAPNIWVAGRRLTSGRAATFDVPFSGSYALYDADGKTLNGEVEVDGRLFGSQLDLPLGRKTVTLRGGNKTALLLPKRSYEGLVCEGADNERLFADVYY